MRGWGSPRPISIRLADRDELTRMRVGIATDIGRLLPRCEALDRALPQQMVQHGGYVRSKLRRQFDLTIEPIDMLLPTAGIEIDPPPCLRYPPAAPCSMSLADLLRPGHRILCVGEVTEPALLEALNSVSAATHTVVPGDGVASPTSSGRARPAANSFSAWLAAQDEADRTRIGVIVLTRQTQRQDMELLRHRICPHQLILVEAGAPVLTWLLGSWGGVFGRHGNIFVFSEPGNHFCEPSNRCRLAIQSDWPRISVVTVSYNQRDYLEQCLLSVLEQHYPNLEYIVVDAGSTDGSLELLREYQKRDNCFARLIIEPDNGQSDGLNKGFGYATGEILTWVNSDDMLAPLSLKRAAMTLRATGADLVVGTCKRVVGTEARTLYKHHSALPTMCPVSFSLDGPLSWCDAWEKGDYFFQPEVFFTRSIWERAGSYLKPYLFWAMDWDLWLRSALAGATVVRIPDVLGVSRQHAAQKTTREEAYLWQVVGILREFDDLLANLEVKVASL